MEKCWLFPSLLWLVTVEKAKGQVSIMRQNLIKQFHFMKNSDSTGKKRGIPVKTGKFGAMMDVCLINDGPVTFILSN